MRHRLLPALGGLCVLALALVPACSKKSDDAPSPASPASPAKGKAAAPAPGGAAAGFWQPTLASFSKAGLKVSVFEQTAARPYKAKACAQGEVDGLDVLLCTFDNEQSARAEERGLQQFIGTATTGATRQRGPMTLAVADRKNVDLKGKQINRLLQVFSSSGS